MEEFTKDLEKLVKAGIGAVSESLNKSAKMIDEFAEKGEPIYQQAVNAVNSTADKVKNAVMSSLDSSDMKAFRESLENLSKEQLSQAAQWIDELLRREPKTEETEEEPACEVETQSAEPEESACGCSCDCAEDDAPLQQECEKPIDESGEN